MVFSINNFFDENNRKSKIADFQDLDHIEGISISTVSAGLYEQKRDDLVLFYFRDGASHATVFTQSKIVSENIKWNKKIKSKNLSAILVNTRNANALTGTYGFKALKELSIDLSKHLSEKQNLDEEHPKEIKPNEILFACTGTIGEKFPINKIKNAIPNLIKNIKYNQNKLIWMKAAMGIITTDTKPKLAMSECRIGSTNIKIYGIAKGAGMIYPNMATTLGFIFTDARLSSSILKKVLNENIKTTFNAISCDGDTSTNDMVSIFSTNKADNPRIKNFNDKKLKGFRKSVQEVLLNLAKRVAADGEGASKFISITCKNTKKEEDAKKILSQHAKKISNSKTEVKSMINKANEDSEKNIIKTNEEFHSLMENRKKNAEERIKQMKNQALKDIKNASVKIAIESVEKLLKNSMDKSKLDKIYLSSIEETKLALKKKSS